MVTFMMHRAKANLAKFINNLHTDSLTLKQECKHYKMLYSKECSANRALRKEVHKLKKQIQQLKNCCERSTQEKQQLGNSDDISLTCSKRKRKRWCRLKSDRTKRQQISEYGKYVLSQIKDNIPHCKRAQLSLCLGQNNVNYNWKSNDFHPCSQDQSDKLNFGRTADHSYASPKGCSLNNAEEENECDIDYSTIFDGEGNWRSQYTFRISHEGYHELRKVGKGHWPPLHHIIQEKSLMSAEIPYTKHTSVCFCHFRSSK